MTVSYSPDLRSPLDVVAHELAHGVTQFTAGLIYKNQSGALNEHFSDVFGTAITQWANNESVQDADWLIGDEIMGPALYGESLRSMRHPGTAYDNNIMGKDPQPAHYDDRYQGTRDNGGVHINSGIPNRGVPSSGYRTRRHARGDPHLVSRVEAPCVRFDVQSGRGPIGRVGPDTR